MKRDFELVRKILQLMEANEDGGFGYMPKIDGYTAEQVGHHAYLMIDAGLIEGTVFSYRSPPLKQAIPESMTWAGHDFLDAAKDDTIWAKARDEILKPVGGMAFSVLLEWLKNEARSRLGLP